MNQNILKFTDYKNPAEIKKLSFILETIHFNIEKQAKGLDLGCGVGNITYPLSITGYDMTGIDISKTNIKKANQKSIKTNHPQFLVGNAELLNINKRFDFCICSELLEHLNNPESAIKTIYKLLKKRGILIVTVPNGYGPYSLVYDQFRNRIVSRFIPIGKSDHVKYFSYYEITSLLERNDFKITNICQSDFLSCLPPLKFSHGIKKIDCLLANKLPKRIVSGWYFVCRKIN